MIFKIHGMISFFRFLGRNGLYTAIEVAGLSIAMAFIVFISYYVFTELSYDSGLESTEDIYLLSDGVFPAGSATIKEQVQGVFPEITDGTRMVSTAFLGGLTMTATVGDETFKQQALGVDANFFDFFAFPFVSGNRDNALTEKYAVSVSESFAARHFPDEDPIGKTFDVTIDKETIPLTVTGVFKDFKNSVFPYVDMIYRIELYGQAFPSLLYNGNGTANTFFRITQGTDTGGLEKQILGILKQEDNLYISGISSRVALIPFKEIHFGATEYSAPFTDSVDRNFISLFIAAGVLLLVFAMLNYVSLTVAQTVSRAKEMAARRLLGERKGGIIFRFLSEAFVLTAVAFVVGLALIPAFEPLMGRLLGKEIDVLGNIGLFQGLVLALFVCVVSLFSGIVPAMIFSRFKPIDLMKGSYGKGGKQILGNIFVFVQNFVAATALCIALAMFVQLRYMLDIDRGYSKDGVIYVNGVTSADEFYADELRAMPEVTDIGYVQFDPVDGGRTSGSYFLEDGTQVQIEWFYGDMAAFRMLGFRPVSVISDPVEGAVWLTESAMSNLGADYGSAGIVLNSQGLNVCGIMGDFIKGNMTEEDSKGMNVCYYIQDMNDPGDFTFLREMLVKVSGDTERAVKKIMEFYEARGLANAVTVGSLDEKFSFYFKKESGNNKLITIFTILTLMLSSMAMLAMSTYYARAAARNVAVRKIFGLSRRPAFWGTVAGFLKIVAVAAAVSVPVSCIVVSRWLENYADRVTGIWWVYVAGCAIVLLVAFIAIVRQVYVLVNVNPAEVLRKD